MTDGESNRAIPWAKRGSKNKPILLLPELGGYMKRTVLRSRVVVFALALIVLLAVPAMFAQETTAGVQATVRDATGGVVVKASAEVTSPALIGIKKMDTDTGGGFRVINQIGRHAC